MKITLKKGPKMIDIERISKWTCMRMLGGLIGITLLKKLAHLLNGT